MTSQFISQPTEYSCMVGRSGLCGEKGIVYDKIRSDSEKTILELVHESGGQKKFKHIAIEYSVFHDSTLSAPMEVNSDGEFTFQGTLAVGVKLLEWMYGVYRVYPEVISAALRLGIEHEWSHTTGIYSAVDKIVKKHTEREIRKTGPPPKDEMKHFVLDEFLKRECRAECEYKANLQAMTSRLKEPGMTFEKLEDEVAAMVWVVAKNRYTADTEDLGVTCSDYLKDVFSSLGDEFKEQINEKLFKIDREYRKRCKEDVGHNL